jgi:CheY-like chemotaxis protein
MAPLGRILVVDDEAPVREVLTEYFAGQGYTVEAAANGEEALASVRGRPPDLVLLDVRMQGMDGIETLGRLRRLAPAVPVIMVTANEDAALARETLRMGAFDYVAKPFDFAYLERAVTAGLLHGGAEPAVTAPADETWAALALAAFRAARAMAGPARASTGERLEAAVLAAARYRSLQALDEVALIVRLATELGDLAAPAVAPVRDAIAAARELFRPRA